MDGHGNDEILIADRQHITNVIRNTKCAFGGFRLDSLRTLFARVHPVSACCGSTSQSNKLLDILGKNLRCFMQSFFKLTHLIAVKLHNEVYMQTIFKMTHLIAAK